MLEACGCPVDREIPAAARNSPLSSSMPSWAPDSPARFRRHARRHRQINSGFPLAKIVAVDIPSGMPSDTGDTW